MKLPKPHFLMVMAAIAIFAAGFVSGAMYMTPEPGLYRLTRVDCSEYENTIDCISKDPPRYLTAKDSQIDCDAWGDVLDLMQKCRASAIDGYGQESQCNNESTWVPRNVDHLDPQLSLMKTEFNEQCDPAAELEVAE